ncbi:ABC transporter ATP-binding protein [Desulfatirhabdium butyrativorans]|uniref:ABC transporter ATP-binding protein n=1 Tax=Desulfatirhabdium butyrativorans TaxID=340467 RepID=UPI0004190A1A|nr:ABC transporter ATP-binding protein [Desulfatirhabdium butyrativorans]
MRPFLELDGIRKSFGPVVALDHVTLRIEKGEILCILGPSGCGKTTLLRLIAGIESPDAGHVRIEGAEASEVPVHLRQIGMVFQDFALFPHLAVWENIAFGLERMRFPRAEIRQRVRSLLSLMQMESLWDRRIDQLSGGQKQRVALARSLAPQPRLLLLDEPLGALDRQLRERLMVDTADILRRIGMTALYVTHDHLEAFAVSDRIAVMQNGCIAQVGTPEEVYQRPASIEIARFFGFENFVPAKRVADHVLQTDLGTLKCAAGADAAQDDETTILIRPDSAVWICDETRFDEAPNRISGTIVRRRFLGAQIHIVIRFAPEALLSFLLPSHPAPPPVGAPIVLSLNPAGIVAGIKSA